MVWKDQEAQPRREGSHVRSHALKLLGVATACAALAATPSADAAPPVATPAPMGTCQTNGVVRAIVYVGHAVYLGGNFTAVRPAGASRGGVPRAHLAACSTTTGRVLAWNPGANAEVLSLGANGKRIYVGGRFTKLDGKPRARLGAVTTAGALSSWNPGANSTVYVVRVAPNGDVLAGGAFTRIGGAARTRIAEVGPGGAVLRWNVRVGQVAGSTCPPRCAPVVFTIAFSGSTVYFGGHFGLVNRVSRNEAAAVGLTSGRLAAWNPNIYAAANCPSCPTPETSRVYTIIPDPSHGRIFTCGGYWKVNGTQRSFNVSAFLTGSGRLDRRFTVQDDGDTPGCVLHKGILFFGGHFNLAGAGCQPPTVSSRCATRHHIAAADTRTNRLLAWNPGANSAHGVYTARGSSGGVGFGGFFSRFGGRAQQGFASYPAARLP
jgi:trimeric autotransporter adhesin